MMKRHISKTVEFSLSYLFSFGPILFFWFFSVAYLFFRKTSCNQNNCIVELFLNGYPNVGSGFLACTAHARFLNSFDNHWSITVSPPNWFLSGFLPYLLQKSYCSSRGRLDNGHKRWNLMAIQLKSDTKRLFCLVLLLGVYLFCGAAVFQVLENENEAHQVNHLNGIRQTLHKKYNMSKEEFEFFVRKIEIATKYGCGGPPESWCISRWSYYASLYFTWSVVTTIGKNKIFWKKSSYKLILAVWVWIWSFLSESNLNKHF